MSNVIDGEFRRVARKRKAMPLGAATAAPSSGEPQLVDDGFGGYTYVYPDGQTAAPAPTLKIPIGVQAWEYLHQGEVQTENVIITGTNNPHAMDQNIFYQMEQDTRAGVDAAVNAAQKVLNTGTSWLTIAAVVFVLFNIFNAGR